MATESVRIPAPSNPTVPVSAEELLAKYKGANELSCKLSGAVGILELMTDCDPNDNPHTRALFAVLDIIEQSLQMANGLQWSGFDSARAEAALGTGH